MLHLSDVHFGSTSDLSVWEYVKGLITRERPNVVACTGDIVDHGGLFMLALARQEFESLKEQCGVNFKLRTVPGNHDCGPWGNLKFLPFSWNYPLVFGLNAMSTDWVVTYTMYRSWSALGRWRYRFFVTIGLYFQALAALIWGFIKGESRLTQDLMREDDGDLGIVFVYLDSNYQLRLATGNVDVKEVTRLKAELLNMRDVKGPRSFAPRIALIHHHPLPIPDARITEGLTSFEPFLVLRNAGMLLRELNRCDIDLILHGHKHYTNFSRLGYSLDHRTEGEIAVLAAGSAGVTHAEQGRNSVNFIDIFKSGRMAYTSIFFGAGAGEPVTELFRKSHFVHGMEMHKMRMHRRAAERQGQWIESMTHDVNVDENGDVIVQHAVSSHHVERDLRRTTFPVRIAVSMGRIAHNTLELAEGSVRAGHRFIDRPTEPMRSMHCKLDVGQYLGPSSSPASYGYSCLGFNTYATSEWETARAVERQEREGPKTGRTVGMEFTSVVVRVPIRRLVVTLHLSDVFASPEPQVRVMRWRSYPDVPLDDAYQFNEADEAGWLYDSDTTTHEAGRLARVGDAWQLSISNPLVGHRYEIRWRVRDPGALSQAEDPGRRVEETRRRGWAEMYRGLLLNLPNDKDRAKGVQAFLSAYLNGFCRPAFGVDGQDMGDDMEVALFAYDNDVQSLRLVAATDGSSMPTPSNLVVPLNEGVVGAAFKRAAPSSYVDPRLTGSTDYGAYLYYARRDEKAKWRYVVALPIFATPRPFPLEKPSDAWSNAACIGVLTIASTSPASGLFPMAEGIARGAITQEDVFQGHEVELPLGQAGEGDLQQSDETPAEPGEDGGVEVDYGFFWTAAHWLIDAIEAPGRHLPSSRARDGGVPQTPDSADPG